MFYFVFADSHLSVESAGGRGNLRVVHQERVLSIKLAEFLDCHVEYTMRKLGSTELHNLYTGPHGKYPFLLAERAFLKTSQRS